MNDLDHSKMMALLAQQHGNAPQRSSPPNADVDVDDFYNDVFDDIDEADGDQRNQKTLRSLHPDPAHFDTDTPASSHPEGSRSGCRAPPSSLSSQAGPHPPQPTLSLDDLVKHTTRGVQKLRPMQTAQRSGDQKEGHQARGEGSRSEKEGGSGEGAHNNQNNGGKEDDKQSTAGGSVAHSLKRIGKSVSSPNVGSPRHPDPGGPAAKTSHVQSAQSAQPAHPAQPLPSPQTTSSPRPQPAKQQSNPGTPKAGDKRKATVMEEDEEDELRDEGSDDDFFSPTGEVPVLDVKSQFVEPWEKLEAEAYERIEKFSTDIILEACQLAHDVSAAFYAEFQKTRAELANGAAAVKTEEGKHNAAVKRYKEYVGILRAAQAQMAAASEDSW